MNYTVLEELYHGAARYLEIGYYPELRVLYWKWFGLLPTETLQAGFNRVLHQVWNHQPLGCVPDLRELQGGWSPENNALLVQATQEAIAYGRTYRIGIVLGGNPDVLTRVSTDSYRLAGLPNIRTFYTLEAAVLWASGEDGNPPPLLTPE